MDHASGYLRVKRLLTYLLPLAAIFAVGSLMEWYDAKPISGEPAIASLASELRAVPHPVSSDAIDEPAVTSRGSAVRAFRHFQTPESAEAVIAYYARELPSLGWQPIRAATRGGVEPSMRFCRGDRSLVIDTVPGMNGTTYYLGLAWAKRKDSDQSCSASNAFSKAG